MKLHVKPFATACGILWGIGMFFVSWWIWIFEGKKKETPLLSNVYRGYKTGPMGSLIGFGWGLIDGIIGGALFAWLYNLLSWRSKEKIEIEL